MIQESTKQVCIHCYVSGRVQGVWYRASAQKKARELNITGWAKNLSDGRVEILACGKLDNIERFKKWLNSGPIFAKVVDIECEELAWQEYTDFETC